MLSNLTKGLLFVGRASTKGICNVGYAIADTVQAGTSAIDYLADGDYQASKTVIKKSLSEITSCFEQTIEDTQVLIDATLNPEKELLTKDNADRLASLIPLGLITLVVATMVDNNDVEYEK